MKVKEAKKRIDDIVDIQDCLGTIVVNSRDDYTVGKLNQAINLLEEYADRLENTELCLGD